MYQIFNLLQDIALLIVLITLIVEINETKDYLYGPEITKNEKCVFDGEFLTAQLGDNPLANIKADIHIKKGPVLGIFKGKIGVTNGYGLSKVNNWNGYMINRFTTNYTTTNYYIYATLLFLFIKLLSFILLEDEVLLHLICYGLIVLFFLYALVMMKNSLPLVSITIILITYLIDNSLFISNNTFKDIIMIVACTLIAFILGNLLTKINLITNTKLHNALRLIAYIAIIILCIIGVVFGKEDTNGVKLMAYIAGIPINVREFIKLLFCLYVVLPMNKSYYEIKEIGSLFIITIIIVVSLLLMKDTGLIIQIGTIFFVSLLLQHDNSLLTIIITLGSLLLLQLIVKVSSTAKNRLFNWIEDGNIINAFLGKSLYNGNQYQQLQAVLAGVQNGGLLGNNYINFLYTRNSICSDIIITVLCQRHGTIQMFLVLLLLVLFIYFLELQKRKQNHLYALFTSITQIAFVIAFILHIGGSFNIIPFTGITLPLLSDGIYASTCFSFLLGIASSFDI